MVARRVHARIGKGVGVAGSRVDRRIPARRKRHVDFAGLHAPFGAASGRVFAAPVPRRPIRQHWPVRLADRGESSATGGTDPGRMRSTGRCRSPR